MVMFHQIPLTGYSVMAPDRRDGLTDGQIDRHGEKTYIPLPSEGENKNLSPPGFFESFWKRKTIL